MGTPPPLPEPVRGLRLEERAPSITTLIVDAVKAVSSSSAGPVCASDLLTTVQVDVPGLQPSRFAGFASDALDTSSRPQASPFATVSVEEVSSCGPSAPNGAVAKNADGLQQRNSEAARLTVPVSPFDTSRATSRMGSHAPGVLVAGAQAGPMCPQQWSPTSFHSHGWDNNDSGTLSALSCQRISDPAALTLPLSAPTQLADSSSMSSAKRLLQDAQPPLSDAEDFRRRLKAMLPDTLRALLPSLIPALLPSAIDAALPSASAAVSSAGSAAPLLESVVPAVLESALPQALAVALPKAISATLNVLLNAAFGCVEQQSSVHPDAATGSSAPPSLCGDPGASAATAAAVTDERQQSLSLEQQCAAEAQLVRMLFDADAGELSSQQQQQQSRQSPAVTPGVLDVAAVIASGVSSPGSSPTSRVGSPVGSGASSPVEHKAGSRPSSGVKPPVATSAAVMPPAASAAPATGVAVRRPSLAAFAGAGNDGAGASLSAAANELFSRRLSDTNHTTSAAAANKSIRQQNFPAVTVTVPSHGSTGANGFTHAGVTAGQQLYCRSSGGSAGGGHSSLGHAEDGLSSVDDSLSSCSGGDAPSPYTELCVGPSSAMGTGAAVNSSANSFLIAGGSGGEVSGAEAAAAAAGLYGISGEALLDRLQQVQQSQRNAAAAVGHLSSPAELLLAAAGGRVGQLVQQSQPSQQQTAAAAAAAAFFQQAQQQHAAQQQAQQQQQQRQAQQEAQATQQQLFQLQQLQALVVGRSLSEQDLGVPPSPPLSTGPGGGLQWRRSSGTEVAFTTTADLWQSDADALGLAAAAQLALGQQQQQQQQQQAMAAAGLLQQQQQQQQQAQQQQQQQQQLFAQSLAAVAAANAAGRSVRAEDFLAFGTGSGGLQMPASAATVAGLGGQAAAAQLAAAAAAAAAAASGAGSGATTSDLASYMDAALRRMLLVSPQVATELAHACGAFSGAHTQLHHICCVIAEQLLDVAAMAPEVAAALLRALAAHRTRGAQATDVDPRVMGRILQLLRAGPAGRQLCLVSLEQWVDGLSRIHKRRAYLDTILHNYQLTLKRLVQAMGHQVHAVNMALPRQLLNDLSPRALLLITAELAPYPLLQPRRWSEEIIWTLTQMHAMGIDMQATGVSATAGAAGAQASAPTSAFQWEIRRALAATADDIAAAGGAAAACGQSPPSAGGAGSLTGLGLGSAGQAASASGSTTPGGTAVPWAAHAALHRHLLLGLRRVQSRFFSERLRKMHGLYGEPVEALLRSSLPQDVLVPEREVVVLVAVLLMLECRIRPEDFDAAFGRDLQRCLAVSSVEEVAGRLRCGLVPDSPLRVDPHKSRALSQLLKMGTLPGTTQF